MDRVRIRTLFSRLETPTRNRTLSLHLMKEHWNKKPSRTLTRANTKVQSKGGRVFKMEVLGWVMEQAHTRDEEEEERMGRKVTTVASVTLVERFQDLLSSMV